MYTFFDSHRNTRSTQLLLIQITLLPGFASGDDTALAHEYCRPILRPAAANAFALASGVPIRESFSLAILSIFFGFFSFAALSHASLK